MGFPFTHTPTGLTLALGALTLSALWLFPNNESNHLLPLYLAFWGKAATKCKPAFLQQRGLEEWSTSWGPGLCGSFVCLWFER